MDAALPRLPTECKPCHTQSMAVVANLARLLLPVVDLLYPPRCPACGAAIAAQDGLCLECWDSLAVLSSHAPDVEAVATPVYAATLYNETSRSLILSYKHGGRIALSRLLARLIAARMPDVVFQKQPPLLIPVPLHRWRLWQRGFNQAALLASELAKLGKGEVLVDGLVRNRRTPNLGGLGREARERALTGAIALNPARAQLIAGRNVILVDDVLTSGATSQACMTALRSARPDHLAIACFARVEGLG
jgi:ComF family protein